MQERLVENINGQMKFSENMSNLLDLALQGFTKCAPNLVQKNYFSALWCAEFVLRFDYLSHPWLKFDHNLNGWVLNVTAQLHQINLKNYHGHDFLEKKDSRNFLSINNI